MQIDTVFLSPVTGLLTSTLLDGTSVGLDDQGLWVGEGGRVRVGYPEEWRRVVREGGVVFAAEGGLVGIEKSKQGGKRGRGGPEERRGECRL